MAGRKDNIPGNIAEQAAAIGLTLVGVKELQNDGKVTAPKEIGASAQYATDMVKSVLGLSGIEMGVELGKQQQQQQGAARG